MALRDRIRAEATSASVRPRRHRSTRSTVAAIWAGCLLVAAGGVAAATNLVPSGVTHYFKLASPPGAKITHERMLVEHVSANGIRDQFWIARNSGGQRCQEDRTVSADGQIEDAAGGCGVPDPSLKQPHNSLVVGFVAAGKPWPSVTYEVIAHTTLRKATQMEVDYPNGRTFPLTYNPANGWAIGVVPPAVTRLRSVLLVITSNGTVIARKPLPATTHN